MALTIKHPTLTQVMISWFMGSSSALGSLLPAQSPLQISLSAPPLLVLSLQNKYINFFKKSSTTHQEVTGDPIHSPAPHRSQE